MLAVLFRKGIFTMGASIYIADDEKNIRDLITKFLESDGYSVTAFETGDESFFHALQ
jgi:CheY-like chemotaxis protein